MKKRKATRLPNFRKQAAKQLIAAKKIPLNEMESSFLIKVYDEIELIGGRYVPANQDGLEAKMLEKLSDKDYLDVVWVSSGSLYEYKGAAKGDEVMRKIDSRANTLINQYANSDFADSVGIVETVKPCITKISNKPMKKKTTSKAKTTAKRKPAAQKKSMVKKKTTTRKPAARKKPMTAKAKVSKVKKAPSAAQKRQQDKIKEMSKRAVQKIYYAGSRGEPIPTWKSVNKAAAREVFKSR